MPARSIPTSSSTHRERLRACLGVVLLVSAGGAAHASLTQPGADEDSSANARMDELLLQVDLNQQRMSDIALLLRSPGGQLFASADDLQRWRLRLPTTPPRQHQGQPFYPLDALPGLHHELDPVRMSAALMASPEAFLPFATSLATPATVTPAARHSGGFANYDVFGESAGARSTAAGTVELGVFNGFGVGLVNFLAQRSGSDARALTRLETSWIADLPAQIASLRVGDAVSRAGLWGRALRFGGVQYARNFGTQPNLVTQPLQGVSGSAALPSTVEVYVNDALSSRSEVPPGPFSIAQIPVVTGAGDIRVVARDILGREQVITQPFYQSAQLLAAGSTDFSFELGSPRQNFGRRSAAYRGALAAATWREGLRDHLTAEVRGEWQADHASLGVGATVVLGAAGAITAALIGSHGNARATEGAGGLGVLGFERLGRRWNLNLRTELASPAYRQLGQSADEQSPRQRSHAFVGYNAGRYGAVGLALARVAHRGAPAAGRISATYSLGLGTLGHLGVALSRALDGGGSTLATLSWTMPLGERGTRMIQFNRQSDQFEATAMLQQALPAGAGFGYALAVNEPARYRASLSAQGDAGTISVDAARTTGQSAVRLGASGGVAFLGGGSHFSRRISDSFALVQIPGHADVRVYADNQLVGRTDARGEILLPRLRAYERNPVTIEQLDLAHDASVGALALTASPHFRSGVVLAFPVTRTHGAVLALVREDGTPVPAGARVTLAAQGQSFPVGYDGEVYLTGLQAHNPLHAAWGMQRCVAAVRFVDLGTAAEPLPHLGRVPCREVAQ